MNCIKCGREIPVNQVFCDGCLEVMEKYPVKPDVAINLPHRPEHPTSKKSGSRKRQLPPEEQVIRLQKKCRRLIACMLVFFLLFAVACAGIFYLVQDENTPLPIGRNYTIDPQE